MHESRCKRNTQAQHASATRKRNTQAQHASATRKRNTIIGDALRVMSSSLIRPANLPRCNILQRTAARYNTLQHAATCCNNTLQHTGQCRILAVYNTQDVGYELLQSDGTKSLVFTHSHRSLQQYGNNALQQHTATTHCNTQGNEGYGLRIVAGRWHENSCLHRLTPLTATTYCNNKLEQHTATTHCNNALQHAGQ